MPAQIENVTTVLRSPIGANFHYISLAQLISDKHTENASTLDVRLRNPILDHLLSLVVGWSLGEANAIKFALHSTVKRRYRTGITSPLFERC